jgi:hypothetical protein
MMYNFGDGHGPVAAHRHANGGGWVADTATVSDSAYVGPVSQVMPVFRVMFGCRVFGEVGVYDNDRIMFRWRWETCGWQLL